MTQHVSWPSIENFHNLRREILKYPHNLGDDLKVTYKAKVKLHGTNAGVRIDPDGTVTALSRNGVVTKKDDNAGFAAWVETRETEFASLSRNFTIVLFGEWCGPGIQKGVAVNKIPHRVFAVFGMRVPELDAVAFKPEFLEALVSGIEDVHVIPWYADGEEFVVDWSSAGENLQQVVDVINKRVEEVEREDPWARDQFGVSGVGEGLVFYPHARGDSYKLFSSCVFKAKGEKHAVVAKTQPAQVDPTVAQDVAEFARMVATEARLLQGATLVASRGKSLMYDMKHMGEFLKWVVEDVKRECVAEIDALEVDKKLALAAVMKHSRGWFADKSKKI